MNLRRIGITLVVVCARSLLGQVDPTASHTGTNRPTPVVTAASLTGSIKLHGKVDEPAWASASPGTSFRQYDPTEGAPATEKTEFIVLVGADALYIGSKRYESKP